MPCISGRGEDDSGIPKTAGYENGIYGISWMTQKTYGKVKINISLKKATQCTSVFKKLW